MIQTLSLILFLLMQAAKLFQQTPAICYKAFRFLFCFTKGGTNDQISSFISKMNGKYDLVESTGILGNIDRVQASEITKSLKQSGFIIFEHKIDNHILDKFLVLANRSNCYLKPPVPGFTTAIFDSEKPKSVIYQLMEEDLVYDRTVQEIMADKSLLHIAQEYLGTKPIQDMVTMWWSTSFQKKADSKAAQLFHFDMDRLKFIKFFIYLTDVSEKNGPHVYVKGSHRSLPPQLAKDTRFDDHLIESYYGKENIIKITGKKGTIIAADTRGIHKGLPIIEGHRLIFQLQFSNSLFGQSYEKYNLRTKKISASLSAFCEAYPYTMQRYFRSNK